jgi:hypothetical protein
MRGRFSAGWETLGLEVFRVHDFSGTHLQRPGIYVVCFGATWCLPTRRFAPMFASRNGSLPAKLAIADITKMDDPLWDTFQIRITPSIVVFREGDPVGRFDGRWALGLRRRDLDRMAEFVGAVPGAGTLSPARTSGR